MSVTSCPVTNLALLLSPLPTHGNMSQPCQYQGQKDQNVGSVAKLGNSENSVSRNVICAEGTRASGDEWPRVIFVGANNNALYVPCHCIAMFPSHNRKCSSKRVLRGFTETKNNQRCPVWPVFCHSSVHLLF